MTYIIDIQHVTSEPLQVTDKQLEDWAKSTLQDEIESAELTIRFTDNDEITALNNEYRKQNKATNVLAFPANIPDGIKLPTTLLGDIIICPEVVLLESEKLAKSIESHFALMVVHGVLHLLGYDHIEDPDAEVMQAKEIKILTAMGFDNPYIEDENEA